MEQTLVIQKKKRFGFSQGIGITLLIAIAAKYLAELPFLNIMGQLVIAILIGMVWRALQLESLKMRLQGRTLRVRSCALWNHLTWNAIKSC